MSAQSSSGRTRSSIARRTTPFARDLIVTVGAQAAVMIGGLLLYRLLALRTGTTGFGSYALVKQSVSLALPVLMVGTAVAVPRYIALGAGRSAPPAGGYLVAGIAICAVPTLIAVVVALLLPHATASLFFGESRRTNLVVPLGATAVATVAVGIAYGYLRGTRSFGLAAWLQIIGVAAAPVVIILALPHRSVGTLILVMAIAAALCAALALLPALPELVHVSDLRVTDAARTLLSYGYRRIPADGFEVALLAVPPIVVAHTSTLRNVSYVSTGMQLLVVLVIAVKPLGLVILPSLSRLWADDRARARKQVLTLVTAVIHIALFATAQLLLFSDVVVRAWLGPRFAGAGPVIRVIVLPSALFLAFIALRSVIDAVTTTAYNSRTNAIAFVIFVAAAASSLALHLTSPVMCIAGSFALGVATQGALSLAIVHRLFEGSLASYGLPPALLLSLIPAGVGVAARLSIVGSGASLLAVIAVELPLAALYLGGLVLIGVQWPAQVLSALRAPPRGPLPDPL